jgi:hypothetical protein
LPTVVAAAGLFISGAAGAAQMQTSFAGVVTANNPFVDRPTIGSPFVGSFTIDPSSSNLVAETAGCAATASCWTGAWAGPTTSWSLNGMVFVVGAPFLLRNPGVTFNLTDSLPGQGPDIYTVYLGGLSLDTVKLTLTDSTGTAFEAAANRLFPSFASFDSSNFIDHPLCLTGISCALNPYYSGPVTSLVSAPVPEPGTAALMLAGLMATGGLARRRSRSQGAAQAA